MIVPHGRYLKLVSASVDGRISQTKAAILDMHCRKCRTCRAALHDLRKLRGLLADNGAAPVTPYFMTRLHARLREEPAAVDPWAYEAIHLFPVFALIALVLILFLHLSSRSPAPTADELFLGSITPVEHRVLVQSGPYTKDEVLVLALTDGRDIK